MVSEDPRKAPLPRLVAMWQCELLRAVMISNAAVQATPRRQARVAKNIEREVGALFVSDQVCSRPAAESRCFSYSPRAVAQSASDNFSSVLLHMHPPVTDTRAGVRRVSSLKSWDPAPSGAGSHNSCHGWKCSETDSCCHNCRREPECVPLLPQMLQSVVSPSQHIDSVDAVLASVTNVEVTGDLQIAKVYVSITGSDRDQERAMNELTRMRG